MRLYLLNILLFTVITGHSQDIPKWVSSDYRSQFYPSSSYIVGFEEQWDVGKKDVQASIDYLSNSVKSEITESIKVNIKSSSTSKLMDYDGEVTDYYKNQVESSSQIKLVGMKVESFYDKKEKKCYAFAVVNKTDLGRYYSDIIRESSKKLQDAIDYAKSANSGNPYLTFDGLFNRLHLFEEIEEAQGILIALGGVSEAYLESEKTNRLRLDFFNQMEETKKDERLSLMQCSQIAIKELTTTISKNKKLGIFRIGYEDSGIESEFSKKYKVLLKQATEQFSDLVIDEDNFDYQLKGKYWVEGDYLSIKLSVLNRNDLTKVSSSRTYVRIKKLEDMGVAYYPEDLGKVKNLSLIKIESVQSNIKGKAGIGIEKELEVRVTMKGEVMKNVPIQFFNNNDRAVYCSNSITSENGIASCKVNSISGKYTTQVIKASIDLKNYISIDPSSEYYKNNIASKSLGEASFRVSVTPSIVSFNTIETLFGDEQSVKLVEPEIKNILSRNGFKFSSDQSLSDFVITINATSRKGANLEGLHFAFVDVNVSVFSNSEGKEIFKEAFTNYKGAGGSFDQAASKAYYQAGEDVKKKIVEVLAK